MISVLWAWEMAGESGQAGVALEAQADRKGSGVRKFGGDDARVRLRGSVMGKELTSAG